MEIDNIYWSLFEGSGSVHAYLAYKELCATEEVYNKVDQNNLLGWLYELN